MVNETIDIASHNFDFHFGNANQQILQQEQQQHQENKQDLALQRSCSGYDFIQKDQLRTSKDLLVSPLNEARLLANTSADNLSWTFFDQVSSVDNHLRFDETSSTSSIGAVQLMTTTTNDVNSMVSNEHHQVDQQQPHLLTIANLSNGTSIKKNFAVDIVSQQSPDLLQQQQEPQQQNKHRHKRTNSTINAVATKTLRQNQEQNQQQEQQLQHHQIHPQQQNSNNQTILATKNSNNNNQQQSTQKPQKSPNRSTERGHNHNDPTTAMITSGIEPDIERAGTTRSARIRNLPAITKLTSTYAEGVDLVGDTKTVSQQRVTKNDKEALRRKKMGANSQSFIDGIETHLGLKGWRKKCLYTLLVLLMLLIIVNLVLTLWILKVMEFSTEGMGQLKIIPGGIQLTGQALIMDMLRASTIRSRHGQPISIESSRNFSINTRDTNGVLENHLFLGHDKLECLSTGFHINDTTGRNLFSVNRDEVTIGAHALRIDGEGGAIFRESIQTPHVRAEPGRELRLESPTRQLELTAAKDINLQSRAGGIELSALEDVKLSALDGSLRLESSKILMPNLRTAQPPLPGTAQSRDHLHRVFQLCACSNGKLFLAAPHSICAGDDSTVCR